MSASATFAKLWRRHLGREQDRIMAQWEALDVDRDFKPPLGYTLQKPHQDRWPAFHFLVCDDCGSVVAVGEILVHDRWHIRLREALR